ncbi:hypothetical protein [Microbacterium sp. CR_7]|uniref:hypothetical protein n=1 Tax=Microbacterium sp. CR_7 TaxID=3055792 RepID=UPI0035C1E954
MDPLVPGAPWLLALAGLVSGAACLAAWRRVPWQVRQMALLRASALIALAVLGGGALSHMILGVLLLLSAMAGTIGVRGLRAAPMCFHRAVVSLVLAICLWDTAGAGVGAGAGAGEVAASVGYHDHGPQFTGILSLVGVVGVIGVVLWTIVSQQVVSPSSDRRTRTLLGVESWSMAAGVALLCLAM